MDFIAPLLGMLGFFTMIGWIVFVVTDGRRRAAAARGRSEFHSRILDKFSTAGEFTELLGSEAGRRLLESFSTERTHPADRIIGSVQKGVILTVVGGALLLLRTIDFEVVQFFTVAGTIVLALGIGFLVSSFASYRLSRSLGVIGGAAAENGSELERAA